MDKAQEVKKILEYYFADQMGTGASDDIASEIVKLFSPPPVVGDLRDRLADFFSRKRYVTLEKARGTIGEHSDYADADSIFALIDIDKMAREREYVKLAKEQTLPEPIKRLCTGEDGTAYGVGYRQAQQDMLKAGWRKIQEE